MPVEERVSMEFSQRVTIDLHEMFLGERLGGGLSREVFVYQLNPKWVVKIETGANHFQNVNEYKVWQMVKGTWAESLFAPVHYISPLGTALIMDRTREGNPKTDKRFPKKVPEFLADARGCNWGLLRGRWVLHDYGFTRLMAYGLQRAKHVPLKRVLEEDGVEL
jgi:hypothetical protein